jgi:hypothetical protein
VIFGIGAFFAAMALAVDTAHLWNVRGEMRLGADAACLAAALELVDDELLTGETGVMALCIERARLQAQAYGESNPVLGLPLVLDSNWQHDPLGDIVFGYLDQPRGAFQPATELTDPYINAIRIIARRTRERGNPAGMYFARLMSLPSADVVATATAMLDRDVIGFRPLAHRPLPLAPIGLLTDQSLVNEEAWESQVLGGGEDKVAFDRRQQAFVVATASGAMGDGILEMTVHIPLAGQPGVEGHEPNGCFLQLGDTDWEALTRQIVQGVSRGDLAGFDGQLVLGWDNRLYLPGHDAAPALGDARLPSLLDALQTLQTTAEPRIWPLFAALLEEPSHGQVTAMVQGFVAARLVSAEIAAVGDGTEQDPKRQELRLRLQPCMLSTGTAITDVNRRFVNPAVDIHNAWICKVRLVE